MTSGQIDVRATPTAERPAGPLARWSAARRRERCTRDEDFSAFVAATAPRLRRTAYLMCRDWHLAQDLTQITFTRMYASWARIRHAANLDAYSRRVLMNAVFDQRSRRSGTEVVCADLPERPEPAAATDLHVALMTALATLPIRDQAIVVLRHWEDQSVATVAQILRISVSAVKMRDARALSRIRALLGEDFTGS
ncbi:MULTISPECIES: SigE family RNA polymerase sigma factor [unclassified Micromonospora]|uniref:SigE family RNA polymerase sigma factor n=1 Tax=unclassified Micromonospora TaxID=2617518 RepID=UPI0003EEB4DC|nr:MULTISPECIES: SigE family RNA polymerase sigma factor [unclassified Micromonospora]EWM67011.1 RNA polymerase sigma-E factor [Micromonospora sp. M42]MCK1807077.1 SigE family RNA polymerase sigma factor [Micromonospora sp. R42106]MCK1831776.1 SigE family RNA polymerase sigma factor [Micromonospora sp. R42003]MCK1844512.1 SigE family RNA polymerase sigma factor [Micromonospora sp. R42004]MCM1016904.1 SigE family RNA polymerase sigma factor [Micromonospora sp. XM-20-01]